MATAIRKMPATEAVRAEVEAFLAANEEKSLLRFITCGSVDDGKSTLIGRLLYDSKMLLEDQLAALDRDSRRSGGEAGKLDFASLVDGLAAEREQGITIDVAYRFFATDRRKFIVADTPGHEQYTRNMATGASTADLALILIDARKGVLTQTRRHSYLVSLLGIRTIVLAVTKMDLVGYDQAAFDRIVADYARFAREAGMGAFTAIPLSGREGDNVTARSPAMPWYAGPTLLEQLETAPPRAAAPPDAPFRMAVQWVNRPDQNFRGYAGTISSGGVRVGDAIAVLPSGRRSTVARIVAFSNDLDEAFAGQSITLTLADEVDCARGDLLASPDAATDPAGRIGATLVWMGEEAMVPHRSYWLKTGTRTVSASIGALDHVVDVNSMERRREAGLALNGIGEVEIDLDSPIAPVRYAEDRQLGGFILIDKVTHATVAAGLVRDFSRSAARTPDPDGAIVWVAGASAAQRTAYALRAQERLEALGRPSFVLDEARIRGGISIDLGPQDEIEHIRRVREVARLMSAAGVHVLVTVETPAAEAHPGRRVDAAEEEGAASGREGLDEWVI